MPYHPRLNSNKKSIVYHVDSGNIFKTHQIIGHKFCLSGGIPNTLLSYGTPDEIRSSCKKVIDEVAREGGYIMDASAIIQNDATIENMHVLPDFTREYGIYSDGSAHLLDVNAQNIPTPGTTFGFDYGMDRHMKSKVKPGLCIPWEERRKEIPIISGNEPLVQQIWEDVDSFGNMFIWQCLLSF